MGSGGGGGYRSGGICCGDNGENDDDTSNTISYVKMMVMSILIMSIVDGVVYRHLLYWTEIKKKSVLLSSHSITACHSSLMKLERHSLIDSKVRVQDSVNCIFLF